MKLILKLIAGIIIGILLGLYAPLPIARAMVTVKVLLGELIFFVVPLIILFFITSGIAALGKDSGKMVGVTTGLAYTSTIIAGHLALLVAFIVIPFISAGGSTEGTATEGLKSYMDFGVDPIFSVMTALILAFILGIGIAKTGSTTLQRFFDEGKNIIELMIAKVIIPILPFYIAGIFVEVAHDGGVYQTLTTFGIVLLVAVLTHWVWLIILYSSVGAMTKQNPFKALKTMLPAYFTAIGTMSSAATIPVTLRQTKENKVSDKAADFVIPLCANIHLSGSIITLVLASTAVMVIQNHAGLPSYLDMLSFILLLGVVMIAAPGVPGGAVMASLGILSSVLGFDEAALGLMIALYTAQDSFGTATNVTGDGAIAMLVDKWSGRSAKSND